MNRAFVSKLSSAATVACSSRRQLAKANKPLIAIHRRDPKSQWKSLSGNLESQRSMATAPFTHQHYCFDTVGVTNRSNNNDDAIGNLIPAAAKKFQTRNFHSGVPSFSKEDTSETKPGSNAFMLESERHALYDLFQKFSIPEHPRCLDREGLRKALKAVGETPDDETLEKIFLEADLDGNGFIELEEFLQTSDKILGGAPAGIVLLVGGPGSGKGMLSKRLIEECGVVHISSGDLLREEVERETPIGKEVKEIMIRGDLVTSAIIVTLMRRKMRRPENAGKRVLLDGFPRSQQNAEDLIELCGQPELALHLECDDTVLIERILNRREESMQEGKVRDDDNIKTALKRLRNYHKYLNVTLDWLRENHVPVVNLDCDCPPDQVWEQLMAIGRLVRPATAIDSDILG